MAVYYCKPLKSGGYSDAFNGLGEVSGLRSGDTLVLSGHHDKGYKDNNLVIRTPGVTVMGDPDDPFKLVACGARLSDPDKWTGPDDYGAYYTGYPGSTRRVIMQGKRLLERMYTRPDETWEDGCFYQEGSGKRIYIKPLDRSMEDVFYTSSSFGIKIKTHNVVVKNLEAILSNRPFEFIEADNCYVEGLISKYADHGFQVVNTQNGRFYDLESEHCAVGGYLNSGAGNKWITSGCVFSWVKIHNNDQYNYFGYSDNHGWGVQGGNNNLFEAFDIDGCAGSGFTTYQFKGQMMCNNIYRDMDIRNIRSLSAKRRRNERGFEFSSSKDVEADLHTGNKAYNISVKNAGKIGVRLKSLYSTAGSVWECSGFDISDCPIGVQITGKAKAGLKFTDSKIRNCKINIDGRRSYMPHVKVSYNT